MLVVQAHGHQRQQHGLGVLVWPRRNARRTQRDGTTLETVTTCFSTTLETGCAMTLETSLHGLLEVEDAFTLQAPVHAAMSMHIRPRPFLLICSGPVARFATVAAPAASASASGALLYICAPDIYDKRTKRRNEKRQMNLEPRAARAASVADNPPLDRQASWHQCLTECQRVEQLVSAGRAKRLKKEEENK